MRGDFLDLYDQQHPLVIRFMMNAGANLDNAQDTMQEAFLAAWKLVQAGKWEHVTNPPGWLRVTALHSYYRQPAARSEEKSPPSTSPTPAGSCGVADAHGPLPTWAWG